MPTAEVMSWSGQKIEPYYRPDEAVLVHVKLVASVNYPRGTVLGEVTATPGTFGAYVDANVDGTGVAKAILPFDVQTDASGNATFASTAAQVGGEFGQTSLTVPVYVRGFFRAEDLVGLDAAGLTDLKGRIVHGTITVGVIGVGV